MSDPNTSRGRDMISSKFNQVQRNLIWRELLRKEYKRGCGDAEFHLNPATMAPVALKPTEVTPAHFLAAARGQDLGTRSAGDSLPRPTDTLPRASTSGTLAGLEDELLHELEATLAKSMRVPTQKFAYPMTTAHDIGWKADQGPRQFALNKEHFHPLSSCDEAKYARVYSRLFGKSPFAKA